MVGTLECGLCSIKVQPTFGLPIHDADLARGDRTATLVAPLISGLGTRFVSVSKEVSG
jgi:hypothetical protein